METSLYFFITYSLNNQENENDFNCIKTKNKDQNIECIYSVENFENGMYYYKKVFKLNKQNEKENKNAKKAYYWIIFEINNNIFQISFDSKGNTFIYDVSLEIGKKIIETEILRTIGIFYKSFRKNRRKKQN